MATVSRAAQPVNSLPLDNPVLLHALAVAAKQASHVRDQLLPGKYAVEFSLRCRGTLKVGHDSEGARSVTPDANELVAFILSKLNAATRAKILRELPGDYAAHGMNMPPVDARIVADTATMLQQLRRTVPQKRHGAVSGDFDLELLDSGDPTAAPTDLQIVG